MTYIKNNKTLVFIIAILLLSNIALLYFFVNKDDKTDVKKPQHKSFREYMVETLRKEVGFNDEQIARYEELSVKHKQAVKPLFNEIHTAKEDYYRLLNGQPSDSLLNNHLNLIGEKQKMIDQKIFNHFQALKQVCTPEQLPKFDSAIQEIVQGMINPSKKGNDKKK